MTRVTFKQFNAFIEAPLIEDEQLNEIWPFRSKEEKEKAQRQKLELLARRGDLQAKAQLLKLQKDDEKRAAAQKAQDAAKEKSWQTKKAEVEAGERGSSRAFDRETGSTAHRFAPRWNASKREWEKYDPLKREWVGTGDKDQYSGETERRGAR